jgi:type VI secretion system protein ImpI
MENQRLRLRITNMSSLPDGGPLEVSVAPGEILEVGRDSGIGWSLPDPRRFISSRHMELRHDKGGWWLYDISTNGTFVNGGAARVKSPYALQAGDRLQVGHYSVEVRFEAEATGPGAAIGADIGAAIGAGIGAPRPPISGGQGHRARPPRPRPRRPPPHSPCPVPPPSAPPRRDPPPPFPPTPRPPVLPPRRSRPRDRRARSPAPRFCSRPSPPPPACPRAACRRAIRSRPPPRSAARSVCSARSCRGCCRRAPWRGARCARGR